MPTGSSFAVVTTAREPLPLIAGFLAHYLAHGAAEIVLFLDAPDPTVTDLAERLPGVRVITCDDAFYRANFGLARPGLLFRRQRLNANFAFRQTGADWMLHVDADEFLRCDDLPAALARADDAIDSFAIANGERVFRDMSPDASIFGGALRRQFLGPERDLAGVLGADLARFTDRGFTGHALGKAITRSGRGLALGVHRPKHWGQAARTAPLPDATLIHYDGLSPLHWVSKLLRYHAQGLYTKPARKGGPRVEQVRALSAGDATPGAARDLHDRIKWISDADHDAFAARGLVEPLHIDPEADMARLWGAKAPATSIADFDAALVAQRKPEDARFAEWADALQAA